MYSTAMPDPVLTVNLSSGSPAYRQVVDQIRLLVQTGGLAPGHPLPGVRQLAAQLGVHHNTIAEAYRTLAAEGLLDLSHGRRAAIAISPSPPHPLTDAEAFDLRTRLRALVAELRSKGIPANTILDDTTAVLRS